MSCDGGAVQSAERLSSSQSTETVAAVLAQLSDDRVPTRQVVAYGSCFVEPRLIAVVTQVACKSAEQIACMGLASKCGFDDSVVNRLLPSIVAVANDTNTDVRSAACRMVRKVAKACVQHNRSEVLKDSHAQLVPALMQGIKSGNRTFQTRADRALFHLLQLKQGDALVQAYVKSGGTGSSAVVDHCKKLAKRMTGESDEEGESDIEIES